MSTLVNQLNMDQAHKESKFKQVDSGEFRTVITQVFNTKSQ